MALIRGLGAAFLLLFIALRGLLRPPDRFTRRQIIDALLRGAILPIPLLGALAAILGATVALSLGTGFAVIRIEELIFPVLRNVLLRQAVPLVVGLLCLGQAGLGLAVGLARLDASGEADTLRSLGIPPTEWILPPSLFEFLLFGAVQFVCAAGIAQLAAVLVFQLKFGVPASHYTGFLVGPAARFDLWNGVARSEASALLVWMIAATVGCVIEHGPDRLGRVARLTFVIALIGLLLTQYVFNVVSG